MIRKPVRETLASKIAGILTAVPAQFDPDDDHIDDTSAKLADFGNYIDEDGDDEELLSQFRKQNIDFLDDIDKRYAGKKGSRKSLKEGSSDEDLSDEDNNSIQSDNNDEESNTSEVENSSEYSDNQLESEDDNNVDSSEDENFQHIEPTNQSEQIKKGLSVRNQLTIWENLLEARIQLQKCLLAANKFPQGDYYKEMLKQSNDESNFKRKINETKDNISQVLDNFLILQNLVIKKFPETKNLGKENEEKVGSDEEIASDTEDELENKRDVDDDDDDDDEIEPQKKKKKLSDYENDILNSHEKYKSYRNETIEKWNSKTRLSMTKNTGQLNSILSHIEHILSNKEKLLKRTQLKRTEYKILGLNMEESMENNEEENNIKQSEEYNTEIFDDNDFYHQLLRELIEVKSADITDPVQLGKQWIQLQNLRSKMKRKIDTKATKGRRIRYAVHTKLVNFMAPLYKEGWTEGAKNELYSSLFGKIKVKRI